MSAPKLPAVRLTPEGECVIQEGVSLDLPPNNKFSISYAPSASRRNSFIDPAQAHLYQQSQDGRLPSPGEDGVGVPPIAEEGGLGEEELNTPQPARQTSGTGAVPSQPTSPTYSRMKSFPDTLVAPFMPRTRSMPLPSQLSQLQHPHRHSPSGSSSSTPQGSSSEYSQVQEVSMELADSIQLVIQTMLQISPPQVLDPAKEQFSACTLSVPTSSMSAMFTAMKNINYISANMASFCETPATRSEAGKKAALTPEAMVQQRNTHMEFDIGEMLQCVGDTLSGAAAQAGVDLVLYHGDVGLKHVFVSGDESGISFALSHIVRQVLNTAERGDSIELGLLVSPVRSAPSGSSGDAMDGISPIDDATLPSGPVQVKIRVSHKFATSETSHGADRPKDVVTTEIRPQPSFSTLFLRRILRQIEGTLVTDLPPPESFTSGRTCDLELVLDSVPVPPQSSVQEELQGDITQEEPTIERLAAFGDTLKGKKVSLYASAKGSFAQHLTSYLTAWGMDVNHVSPDGQAEGLTDQLSSMQDEARQSAFNPFLGTFGGDSSISSQKQPENRPTIPASPNFIFIDDDVDILKERLQALRFEFQPQYNTVRKRPSLSAHHRPRSSPQIARILGINNLARSSPVVIMHFTSLANYKVAKDAMQSIMASYASTSTPLPEVMIIPKPAGPRRFLTALYTAVTKPVVDPWFMPIATSPMSPSVPHSQGSFFGSPISEHEGPIITNNESQGGSSQAQSPVVKNGNRPSGTRTNSDRSTRSNDNATNLSSVMPPSPLALPDNVEYFSAAAERLGASPSSGLVIQSPDGQTAGIYFHPRSKNSPKNASSQSMERDRGQLGLPAPRRGSTPRVPSGSKKDGNVSFASLHEVSAQTDKPTSPLPPPRPSPSSSISAPSITAISGLPVQADEEPSPVASASTSALAAPVARRLSEDGRKGPTPATSPTEATGTPSFRRTGKRERTESKDGASSSAKKSKSATGSDNVVPPISVLIVDDNPINQTILSTFMRRKKIKYDLASNGQEAVQKWRTGGFHLILMDIQMPVMDGIQATKEIRRLEKSNAAAGFPPLSPASVDEGLPLSERSVPSAASSTTSESRSLNSPYRSSVIIVALTASSLQSDRVAALAAGCNDFLTKPVSLLWLNNKIIEWGSIKALQMWADIRQDGVKAITNGQAEQARSVAERLHVPVQRGRASPSSSSPRKPTSALEDNAAALALASPAGALPNFASEPRSASTSTSRDASRSQSFDATTIREALDSHPLKRKSLEDDTPKPSTSQSTTSQQGSTNATLSCESPDPASTSPTNGPDSTSSTSSNNMPAQNGQARPTGLSNEDEASNSYFPITTASPARQGETIHVQSPTP